jgi:hypothetical protein
MALLSVIIGVFDINVFARSNEEASNAWKE